MAFTRKEIEEALDHMDELRRRASEAGDWSIWGACLSEDVAFIDRIYGRYDGRAAVVDFVCRVHAPFPHVRYQREWDVIDVERGEVIFQQQMILPEPEGYTGAPFGTDVWSRHRYAGDGLWCEKEAVTVSESAMGETMKAWMAAGGRFAAAPLPPPER